MMIVCHQKHLVQGRTNSFPQSKVAVGLLPWTSRPAAGRQLQARRGPAPADLSQAAYTPAAGRRLQACCGLPPAGPLRAVTCRHAADRRLQTCYGAPPAGLLWTAACRPAVSRRLQACRGPKPAGPPRAASLERSVI